MSLSKNSRIAVLLGGLSGEREVSFRTGKAMAQALRNKGYAHVIEIDAGRDIADRLVREKIEIAAIALHGRFGEDGTIQGILEYLRIPYTGTGVIGSAAAIDKVISKRLFTACDVATPPYLVADDTWKRDRLVEEVESKLGFPAVAKPPCEGSTLGLTIVRHPREIEAAQKTALALDDCVLWEKFISGHELTVGFVGGKPLPIIEIVPRSGFYDYESKYTKGKTDYYCPARVSDDITKATQAEALKAFEAVKCESFGRVDIRFGDGIPFVLEVNTIPGMTETSLLPKAAAAAGMTFEEMVESILKDARLKTGGAQ